MRDVQERVAVATAVKALRALTAGLDGPCSLRIDPSEIEGEQPDVLWIEQQADGAHLVSVLTYGESVERQATIAADEADWTHGDGLEQTVEQGDPMTEADLDEHDPAMIYRDATFSREARDWLASTASHLRARAQHRPDEDPQAALEACAVLDDVVARWDANEATEFISTNDTEVSPC